MPFNYLSLQSQIRQIDRRYTSTQQEWNTRLDIACQLLKQADAAPRDWEPLITHLAAQAGHIRCAIPVGPASGGYDQPQTKKQPDVLLAADGSQILPDPHASLLFAAINIGTVILQPGSGQAPQEKNDTLILFQKDLYQENGGLLSESAIALMRDLKERQVLSTIADDSSGIRLAISDGPLELFREPSAPRAGDTAFQAYLAALQTLAERRILTAGYIDRPRADPLIKLLEFSSLPESPSHSDIEQVQSMLRGVSDIHLLERELPPGTRSRIFKLQSQSSRYYTDQIALHFFYLNVSSNPLRPWLARVEIPAWVAADQQALDMVHNALLEQAQILHPNPYPYLLQRAHETALLTFKDKEYLENQLTQIAFRHGDVHLSMSKKETSKRISKQKSRYS